MRKKELLKLNMELFERAEKFQLECEELRKENAVLKAKVEDLILSQEEALQTDTLQEAEEAINQTSKDFTIDEPTEFGAQIIGKIVVSATQHCNKLANVNSGNSKELVNLILGRTEVAKAEILKIVENNLASIDIIKTLVLQEQTAAEDYFKSVLAQID